MGIGEGLRVEVKTPWILMKALLMVVKAPLLAQ